MLKTNKSLIFIELPIIFAYLFLLMYDILFQPINIILGIICVFVFPGLNLMNLIRSNTSLMEKLGYSIILSIALNSAIMLFSYLFLFNFVTFPETGLLGFFYNNLLLIDSIQILNMFLIIIHLVHGYKIKKDKNSKEIKIRNSINYDSIKNKKSWYTVIITIIYFLSLVLLCISTLFSNIPTNGFNENLVNYSSNFTFFIRVPLIFYVFLTSSILCLIYYIFITKNHSVALIMTSIFLYILWILPYLQINNYFSYDAFLLYNTYNGYLQYGIQPYRNFNVVILNVDSLRYSTSLFVTILLTYSTSTNINFSLWYLFPLLYLFIPFLFYSYYKKYSSESRKDRKKLILLTIFAFFAPQVLKSGHTAGTGILGVILFYILIMEFYDLFKLNRFTFKFSNISIIFLIFFLLCLTHLEECIYYLVFIPIYSIYFIVFNISKMSFNAKLPVKFPLKYKYNSIIIPKLIQNYSTNQELKIFLIIIGGLLSSLILIFYITQEIFGWMVYYYQLAFSEIPILNKFLDWYVNTRSTFPFFLRGVIKANYILIIIIITLIGSFTLGAYIIFFKAQNHIISSYRFVSKKLSKLLYYINKFINNKIFQILFIPLFLGAIIYVNLGFFSRLEDNLSLEIIAIILSYSIFALQIFLFIKGLKYYRLENLKQNYFLIAILSTTSIMIVMFFTGGWFLSIYIFQSKFLTYIIFFNMFIIESTYFNLIIEKKRRYWILFILLYIIFAVFYSLRTLRFG